MYRPPSKNADHLLAAKNARRHGRVRLGTVKTSFGPMIDLSASGCRVQLTEKVSVAPGDVLTMEITGVDGKFLVTTRVAWIKRSGWFRKEIGFEFQDITAATRGHLANLARTALITEALGWDRKVG